MIDPSEKRTLDIGGMEQIYDDIDDLASDIDYRQSELRRYHANLGDEIDDQTLDTIRADALAQRDRIDAYNAWAAEILAARKSDIAGIREALRNLPPSPFEEGQ